LNEVLQKRIETRTDELSDTSARLRAEVVNREEAQALQARFRAIAEATSDLVAMAELDGTVMFLNQAGRRLVGIGAEEEIRKLKVRDFYPAWVNELFEREAFSIAQRDGSWSGEVALLHRDGHEIPVSMVGLVLRKPDGTAQYMACIVRDITEQRRVRQELQKTLEQEKDLSALKSRFISMVSHEIRTPLALILSSSEILDLYLDRLTLDKRKQHLSTIKQSVRRLADLTELVLLYSRAENETIDFSPTPVELAPLCQKFIEEVEESTQRRCPIRFEAAELSDAAQADSKLLRHVVTNLLGNAVRYSAEGKPVVLSIRRDEDAAIFCVRDQGVGIPEDDRKLLFTPFYRGKNVAHIRGTGLGLMVVQRCIERMSGSISLESREGMGTTVTVRLPMFHVGRQE
jgi:PAS domain S-box-containing protein